MSSIYNQGQTVRIGPTAGTEGLELRDDDGVLVDADTNVLTVIAPNGTASTPTAERPSTGVYYADVTADQAGVWTWRWRLVVGEHASVADGQFNVEISPPAARAAFATASDLATRLGRSLTDAQVEQVNMLLALASQAIAGACGKDDDWIADLALVPPDVRVVCLEATVRAFVNPDGARTRQEQLGQYGHTLTWAAAAPAGIGLTDGEERRVRRAVFGSASASPRVESIIDNSCCEELTDAAAS